jgi:voltage-gated potassium channel Kch
MDEYVFTDFCRACLEEFQASEGVEAPELMSFVEDPELHGKEFDEEDYRLAALSLVRFIPGITPDDLADVPSFIEDFPALRALAGGRPDSAAVCSLISRATEWTDSHHKLFVGFASIFFNALLRQKRVRQSK